MKALRILFWIAAVMSFPAKADGSSLPDGPLHFSPGDCVIAAVPSPSFRFSKLDERRLRVTWKRPQNSRGITTEVRLSCGSRDFDAELSTFGFERVGDHWTFTGGGGTSDVEDIARPTWTGKASTYFSASVCRAVVGKAVNGPSTFSADYCVGEAEYGVLGARFEQLEERLLFP